MNARKDVAALIGRVLLALMFVYAGYGKIGGFEGVTGAIASKGAAAAASRDGDRPRRRARSAG